MSSTVVVDHLSKRYRLGSGGGYRRLTEVLANRGRHSSDSAQAKDLWALQDVSFEVSEGDVVGIIGRNGAGKSTLLKILSRITEPTSGRATLRGRVGSLLEVGTGFHPELTGRENVFLNGAVLGMRKSDILARFDEIVAFAEVERFLDTPVKRYSSGMYVRLAFAVAAHLEPDILVVDEVLAVGDTAFQKKCLGKMGDVAKSGRTVLFVSHNMAAVRSLCPRGVLLDRGEIVAGGAIEQVLRQYLAVVDELQTHDLQNRRDREGDGRVRAVAIEVIGDPEERTAGSLVCGRPGMLRVKLEAEQPVAELRAALSITNERHEGVLQLDSTLSGDRLSLASGRSTVTCMLDRVPLMPGRYSANVYLEVSGVITDWVQEAAVIEVQEGDFYGTGRLPAPGYGSVMARFRWA
ncbi:MAG: ABC transporter ATP-binding protein [Chloroflexota bacterium]